MKKPLLIGLCLGMAIPVGFASGLPKATVQALLKALQDSNVEVRTAAALAFSEVPGAAEQAVKPLESALVSSADTGEQDVLAKALIVANDSGTPKRLEDSLVNPQFKWGAGAKAKAVEVIAQIGQKKTVKWLTELVVSDQDPAVRAAAVRALGRIGAPPKKDKKE